MSNMILWDQVKVTDPKAVKPITGKPYRGNSPKPYWLIERATEVFGPVGIGWGVTVKSERFVPLPEDNVLHQAVVSVWYVWEGKRGETFDQMGGTKACYRTSKGVLVVDEDAGKKSVTDGMVKCLSMIGFAGDIFSGMWDDSKYVEWAGEETDRRNGVLPPPPPPAPAPRHRPTAGAVVAPDRMAIVNETADAIKEAFDRNAVVDCFEYASSLSDPEEKTALWHLLPAPIRSAIKKHSEEIKETT